VKLCEWLVKIHTKEGETVLDSCMGSGTTGVACVNTKRNFIGYELNENYYQVSLDRLTEAGKAL
jgi:site-specific DNA-methyltransferase (adenine-specific)